jgi:hypothetical protein
MQVPLKLPSALLWASILRQFAPVERRMPLDASIMLRQRMTALSFL